MAGSIDPASAEAQIALEEQLTIIIQAAQNKSLKIIADRIKEVQLGNYTYTSVYENYANDEQEFESVIKSARETVDAVIAQGYKKAALDNDKWAEKYYKELGVTQLSAEDNKKLKNLLDNNTKKAQDFINKNINTKALGVVDSKGNFQDWKKYYKYVLSKAVTSLATGKESYIQLLRQSVNEMAQSGLRVGVEVSKIGYPKTTRELYSSVRMNVMGNYRQMLQQMRNVQGDEYGADGWEITAHGLCAPDHLPYQGNVYTDREYKDIQSGLDRPLVEGSNCRHSAYRVKFDIAIKYRALSEEELEEINSISTEEVTITGLSGEEKTMTRYDATQYQRKLETELRKLNTKKYLEDTNVYNKKIRDVTKTYKDVSKAANLPTYMEYTKAYYMK